MIKYLGSKRGLVPHICAIADALPGMRRVCDLFTGTTRVARALKARGYDVVANDTASYAYELALAFVETDPAELDLDRLGAWLRELDSLPGYAGYYSRTFCEEARYFQPFNGERIDAIRDAIDRLPATRHERAILLTSLLLAADRVDSTTGLQMAYLKRWSPRSFRPLELRLPELVPGSGHASREDAIAFVEAGGTRGADLTYVDPPYNQHSYFANYHVWESLVRHDRPPVYGVARKRSDTVEHRSVFNSPRRFHGALERLLAGIESPFVLVSFSDEGYASADELTELLSRRGYVGRLSVDSKRYVGAQIGIYNPAGEKVGRVTHLRNREQLFLAGDEAAVTVALAAARAAAGGPAPLRQSGTPGLAVASPAATTLASGAADRARGDTRPP